jgi:hypothetical protein
MTRLSEIPVPDSRSSSKSKGPNRASEAWATSTTVLSDADLEQEDRNHDIIYGVRNALIASILIWTVIIMAGLAIFT